MNAEQDKKIEPLNENDNQPKLTGGIKKTRRKMLALVKHHEQLSDKEKAIKSLVKICDNDSSPMADGIIYNNSEMTQGREIIKALDKCYDAGLNHELVSSIIFLFGIVGNEISEDNVSIYNGEYSYNKKITDLDPDILEDRGAIEKMMTYLNSETDQAIEIAENMSSVNINRLSKRVWEIKNMIDNFKVPKKRYTALKKQRELEHMALEDREVKRREQSKREFQEKDTVQPGVDEKSLPEISEEEILKGEVNKGVMLALERMHEDELRWSNVITEILVSHYNFLTEKSKEDIRMHPRTKDLIAIIEPEPVEQKLSLRDEIRQRKRLKKKVSKNKRSVV